MKVHSAHGLLSSFIIGMTAVTGCAGLQPVTTQTATGASRDTPTGAPSQTPAPTRTPRATHTPSPTASPTPHPDAITPDNAGRVEADLVLSGHHAPVWGVALSPDGEQVASASADGDVRVWDAHTGELLRVLERRREWVYTVAYTPDGTRLVSGGTDHTVQVWDAVTGEHLFGLRAFGQPFRLAISPDGGRAAVASLYSARGQMWPLEPGAAWVALEGHTTRLRSVAFSPDGSILATGDEQGTVLLREAGSGEPYASVGGSGGDAYGLAFTADGEALVVGGSDGFIRVYGVASGEERLAWLAHAGGVWDVALSPDGDVVASGGGDGVVILWETDTGERLATAGGHGAAVRGVAFARDGTALASGGDDRRVRLWRLER